ncbi:MAG: pilus assembly protein TadG-related protein [Dehalococcoidia bacterium]
MRNVNSGERGQYLPIMALFLVIVIGLAGLALDAGRLYVARAELTRALDSAALAGVIELPDTAAAESRALAYMQDNEPGAAVSFPGSSSDNQFRVNGSRTVTFVFMRLLGFGPMDVNATAAAGFGIIPSDTVLLVDATGSMGASPCNSNDNNAGCPIWEAKQGAKGFAEFFLDSGAPLTKVGYTPYRGCHNPPRTNSGCVGNSMLIDLTGTLSSIETAIDNTTAVGGTGTNTCLGLYKAREMFLGPNAQTAANTLKSVVLLADGDNTYNVAAYSAAQGAPPTDCRPASNYTSSDGDVSTSCLSAQSRERSLDSKTVDLANSLKSMDIEIYIIAFGVCGTVNNSTPTTTYCNGVGNSDHDNTADQRLLKCIATSTANTNDHFYNVPTAGDLPAVFDDIAHAIAFRLIE